MEDIYYQIMRDNVVKAIAKRAEPWKCDSCLVSRIL